MTVRGRQFELARLTIEFVSPVLVGTGRADALHDTAFAATPDGLPVLPGSSLAGVLRHAWAAHHGEGSARGRAGQAFGFQAGADGAASNVEISFAHPHDANDRPVPFVGAASDPVLDALRMGVIRDHVRINARGTVDERGKFDTRSVPAGARFTFEVVVHAGAGLTVADLCGLLASPSVRIGAKTRSGLGQFRLIRVASRAFDLSKRLDFDDLVRLPRDLSEPVPDGLLPAMPVPKPLASAVTATIRLVPESWWMFGSGDPVRPDHRRDAQSFVDRVNVYESRIEWSAGKGKVLDGDQAPDLAPGTGLKGALRHRVAFHARRREGAWATPQASAALDGPESCAAVRALFGQVADSDEGLAGKGQTGRVIVSDGRIDGSMSSVVAHVSLDRFTQGPMLGLLFSEAPRYGGILTFELVVERASQVDAAHRRALKDALDDLIAGRLAFGAMGSRGAGVAKSGTVTWSDGGRWVNE